MEALDMTAAHHLIIPLCPHPQEELVTIKVHMGNVATVILENTLRATASSRIVISDVCRSVEIQPESEGS
jgi:hypothetical protein